MKVGDKVNICDDSYGFGIRDGEFISRLSEVDDSRKNLTIIKVNLFVMKEAGRETTGEFRKQNDLLVTDEQDNFWFAQSRFCELVNKEVTVRYFCDGKDVTDDISDETKRNLSSIA